MVYIESMCYYALMALIVHTTWQTPHVFVKIFELINLPLHYNCSICCKMPVDQAGHPFLSQRLLEF